MTLVNGLFKAFVTAAVIALMAVGTALGDPDPDRGGGRGGGGGGGRGDGGRSASSSSRDGGSSRGPSVSRGDRGSSRGPSVSRGDSGSSRAPSVRRDETVRSAPPSSDRSIRTSPDTSRSSSAPRTFRESDRGSDRSARSLDASRDLRRTPQYEARRPTESNVREFLGDRDRDRSMRDRAQFDRDRNVRDRSTFDRNRSPQDRELVDRAYKNWQNTWRGTRGDGQDTRDWSGKWRDSDRFVTADRIRRDWDGRRDRDRFFSGDWWRSSHRGNYWNFWGDYAFRYNRPWYWWSWVTAPRLASWFVFGWPTPYYWDYGPGEYIYYDNGAMYINGRWYEPGPVYYDQTVRIIDEAPDLTAESAARMEWMPLGVFAVTPDGKGDADITLQLAVTKEGVIGGTAFDPRSGAAYNIQGMVDKRSQRAVWSYRDDRDQRVVMETSIYNLTQPEATGMVHYGPNDMRVVEIVRLQQPDQAGGPQPTSATLPAPPVTR